MFSLDGIQLINSQILMRSILIVLVSILLTLVNALNDLVEKHPTYNHTIQNLSIFETNSQDLRLAEGKALPSAITTTRTPPSTSFYTYEEHPSTVMNAAIWPPSITKNTVNTKRTDLFIHLTELEESRVTIIQENAYFFGTISQFYYQLDQLLNPLYSPRSALSSKNLQKNTMRPHIYRHTSAQNIFISGRESILGSFPSEKLSHVEKLDTKEWRGKSRKDGGKCPSKALLGLGGTGNQQLETITLVMRSHSWVETYKLFWEFDYESEIHPNTVALIERLLVCSETYGTLIFVAIPPFLYSGINTEHFKTEHPHLNDLESYNDCKTCYDSRNKILTRTKEIRKMEDRPLTQEERTNVLESENRLITLHEILELTKA